MTDQPEHHAPLILCAPHYGPEPLDQLSTEQLFNIGASNCDCYTDAERTQAQELFQQRPDWRHVWQAAQGAWSPRN